MPGGDGTGPAGMGPMTGRAAGYCIGYAVPGYMNSVGPQGFWGWGRGGGRGRGWRNWSYPIGPIGWQRPAAGYSGFGAPVAPFAAPFAAGMGSDQELDVLKGQAEYFEDALDGIRKRIEELEVRGKQD
ncbi:MAG: DUF5320 domain-containing protein [Phycisphaerae bacterium]|nr:DUF5320 domain-containing protein [Phycisphaerae bacterium]